MPHPAIIFDLDGTLLDTLEDIADAANEVLAANGFPQHPIDAYRYFVGSGLPMLYQAALPESARREEIIARCMKQHGEAYERLWRVKTKPYDGIPELLAGLVQRGVEMAVLSNKPDYFTRLAVSEFFPTVRFAAVFGDRPGVPRKPNPASAFETAEVLGAPPADVFYLGDTAIDMQTACAAGMVAVGVLWGFRPREELEASGAKHLLAHPREFFPILDAVPGPSRDDFKAGRIA